MYTGTLSYIWFFVSSHREVFYKNRCSANSYSVMKMFKLAVKILEKNLWRNSFLVRSRKNFLGKINRPTICNFTKKWTLSLEFFKDFNCNCRKPILKNSSSWLFPIRGTPTFKSPVRFKNLKFAKRKNCNAKLSTFERVVLCVCNFWKQEVNKLSFKGLGVKTQS